MTRITVVIEDHAEGIHLGQQLAGGRVVEVIQGDCSGLVEALEGAEYMLLRWGCEATAALAREAITKARGQ
jgi:hypothetical protein